MTSEEFNGLKDSVGNSEALYSASIEDPVNGNVMVEFDAIKEAAYSIVDRLEKSASEGAEQFLRKLNETARDSGVSAAAAVDIMSDDKEAVNVGATTNLPSKSQQIDSLNTSIGR